MTRTFVHVTTSFIGYHRWRDAPQEVVFLRDYHRHVFHVKLEVEVSHDNRDVEFIVLKRWVDAYLQVNFHESHFEHSCEHIARHLLDTFNAHSVTVSEDGECGATITKG